MKLNLFIGFFLVVTLLSAQKPCGFKNGLQEGYCKHFYENGQLKEVANWKKGKLEGPATFFYENGTKKAEGEYKKNFKIGVWHYYHENGKLEAKEKYVYRDHMSVLEGEYISYYPDGQPKIMSFYKDGKRNGDFVAYHENGKIANKGKMKGDACDSFQIFDKEGKLVQEGRLDNQFQKTGLWRDYYSSGKKKAEGNYIAEKEEGEWFIFAEDGKIEKIIIYKNGEEVSSKKQ